MTWHKNCLNCDTNDTKIIYTMAFAKTAVHFKVDRCNTALQTRLIRELVDSMWGLKQVKVSVLGPADEWGGGGEQRRGEGEGEERRGRGEGGKGEGKGESVRGGEVRRGRGWGRGQ